MSLGLSLCLSATAAFGLPLQDEKTYSREQFPKIAELFREFEILQRPDERGRTAALQRIASSCDGHPELLELLRSALHDPDPQLANAALRHLYYRFESVEPDLARRVVSSLDPQNPLEIETVLERLATGPAGKYGRTHELYLVGVLGVRDAVGLLGPFANSTYGIQRLMAVRALLALGETERAKASLYGWDEVPPEASQLGSAAVFLLRCGDRPEGLVWLAALLEQLPVLDPRERAWRPLREAFRQATGYWPETAQKAFHWLSAQGIERDEVRLPEALRATWGSANGRRGPLLQEVPHGKWWGGTDFVTYEAGRRNGPSVSFSGKGERFYVESCGHFREDAMQGPWRFKSSPVYPSRPLSAARVGPWRCNPRTGFDYERSGFYQDGERTRALTKEERSRIRSLFDPWIARESQVSGGSFVSREASFFLYVPSPFLPDTTMSGW